MTLSSNERIDLADRLYASLSEQEQARVAKAWEVEIERRVAEVDGGTAELIPAEKVFAEIEQRLNAKRRS